MAATGSRTLKLSILADVDNLVKGLKQGSGDVETFGSKISDFGKKAGLVFAAAAAAAGAYAIKIGIDGVKSAVADEQAQVKLAGALQAATGATNEQIAAIERQITKTSLASGVADDQLRPALARLALSTSDTAKAQDLLNLALDVSTRTGKPLETVANALGKAYDGNAASLGKLGIGLSAAELKTMSFTDVQTKLTDLFGGAAAQNAETFQGRMDRLKVAFDEAVETIGFALLPILSKLLEAFTTYILPIIEKVSGAISDRSTGLLGAFESIVEAIKSFVMPIFDGVVVIFNKVKDAITDNIDSFKSFFDLVKVAAPVIGKLIGGALQVIGEIASVTITVIAKVLAAITPMLNTAIDGINLVIRGLNIINPFSDIPYLPKIGSSGGVSSGTPSAISGGGNGGGATALSGSFGGGGFTGGGSGGTSGGTSGSGTSGGGTTSGYVDPMKLVNDLTKLNDQATTLTNKVAAGTISDSAARKQLAAIEKQAALLTGQADTVLGNSSFNVGSFRKADAASMTTINLTVNGAIDSEGTTRTIVNTLNDSYYRGTSGANALVGNFSRI
jgi:hypothetical protein